MSIDVLKDTLRKYGYNIRDLINVMLPCKVETVNMDNTVDVLVYRNDDKDNLVFPCVPIKHFETSRSYIFLGIKAGDRGIIRFFDKSTETYKEDGTNTFLDRQHSLNDNIFELGFIPQNESYVFPTDKTIEIGNKNGSFKLSINDNGQVEVISNDIKIECNNAIITANGDIEAISTNANITASSNIDAVCANVNITASGQTNIKSPLINLGSNGGVGVAKLGARVTIDGTPGGQTVGFIAEGSTITTTL